MDSLLEESGFEILIFKCFRLILHDISGFNCKGLITPSFERETLILLFEGLEQFVFCLNSLCEGSLLS